MIGKNVIYFKAKTETSSFHDFLLVPKKIHNLHSHIFGFMKVKITRSTNEQS